MGTLTRCGYMVPEGCDTTQVKKELTARAIVNSEYGFPPPPFKVFRQSKKSVCVPRFYGCDKLGSPTDDKRPASAQIGREVRFVGKLRDETSQNDAFRAAIDAGSGVLSLPCGYGKTTVSLAIAAHLGLRTMIVVHKEFLANQWRERIQQFCPGATIGTVQRDKVETDNDFVIAMLQTLSMKEHTFEQFDSIGTVIVDEAHHICAAVFSQSMFKVCPRHIFGLSATPDRKDGLTKVLHWFMGPTFFSIERENQQQVEVFPIEFDSPVFRQAPPCTRFGKISLAQMITDLTEMEDRNKMLVALIKKASRGTRQLLVLSDRRNHCQYLQSIFPETSGLYMGGMKESELQESSTKKIIFGTFSQAHEGLDIPTLDTIILASPKSDIKQSIGRIMRETGGKKNNPHIYDICDHWSLLFSMYVKRRKVYTEGGFKFVGEKVQAEDTPSLEKGKMAFLL